MFTRKFIATTAIAGLSVLGLTACNPDTTSGNPVPVTRMADAASTYTAPTSQMPMKRAHPADPMSSDGMWKVPEQIAPGDYQIAFRDPSVGSAYYELCADIACKIGAGMLGNDFVAAAPDYVSIPVGAQYIRMRNIVLTPMAG